MLKTKNQGCIVQFLVKLPFIIKQDGDWFISSCPPLDVVSQGKSHQEAEKNLKEALQLFMTTCFEMGTLDQVLKECGFTLLSDKAANKPSKEQQFMDIPLNLVTRKYGDACHA